jgi:phosphoribosylanthranilate isomerase
LITRVKICGLTNAQDALAAVECGADALGFIFHPPSPRAVNTDQVAEIVGQLPPFALLIGVFVDEPPDNIRAIVERCQLDGIQLHGSEPADLCRAFDRRVIKAFRPRSRQEVELIGDYPADAFLLDSYHPELAGGTGAVFDWDLAVAAKNFGRPIILSGGLTPENVGEAVRAVRPYAVDVAGGVEAYPGKKDHEKLKRFIAAAKQAGDS